MSTATSFVENIDAMLGKIGPVKMRSLPPNEQREVRLYYGLRAMAVEVDATHALLEKQQRQLDQMEHALQQLLSRTRP
jgi:hypothetical protein